MTSDISHFQFKDSKGRIDTTFDKIYASLANSRKAFVEALPKAGKASGDLKLASDKLAKLTAGTAYRPVQAGVTARSPFKIRLHDGRDWPSMTLKDGASSAQGAFLDPNELGTYGEIYGHATHDGKITDLETYQNASTAKMGGYVRGINLSPGNKEYLVAHAESGFWWTYTPTKNCNLEIRGLAVQTYARQFRDLVDEGNPLHPEISNVHLTQQNYLTVGYFVDDSNSLANYGKSLQEVGPGSSYSGDGDHSNTSFGGPYGAFQAAGFADTDELVRDGNRSLEFAYRPTVSAQANVPTYCFIGAQSSIYADLDDVKATIRQGSTWQLLRLSIWEV